MKRNRWYVCLGIAALLGLSAGSGCSPSNNSGAADSGGSDGNVDSGANRPYQIVDTKQTKCFDATSEIACPSQGAPFFGQDAQHDGAQPAYRDNGDGTVTDTNTGLMWQQGHATQKQTYQQALSGAASFNLAGYDDWRLPTIKELYGLIEFTGTDPGPTDTDSRGLTPFIDDAFDFRYGDVSSGERVIDAQYATSTEYVSTTIDGNFTIFGVNFADGRIKGYPGNLAMFEAKYVRGHAQYGVNDFHDNGDGTITDRATGLMWEQEDSGTGMIWEDALAWADQQNAAGQLGYADWRLPNVKELQSIVDYTRSPATTSSAAIDPVFHTTAITNEAGATDYPFYWSGTTHVRADGNASAGSYVCFGRCLGYFHDIWQDVHGAGAQRSDPKMGDPAIYPTGHGPQGDAIRIYNYVRLVRDADANR